jgi:transcriptional regulator with XRE-family HTH domain
MRYGLPDHVDRAAWQRAEDDVAIVQRLGERIKAIRESRGMTLAEVGKLCSLPASTLSRVENGKMSPSFGVLARIMSGLQCDWSDLFTQVAPQQRKPRVSVMRSGAGSAADLSGLHYTFLHGQGSAISQSAIVDIASRNLKAVGGLVGHEGEEFCYVLKGELALHMEGEPIQRLKVGDSAQFDSTIPHAYLDAGRRGAQLLIIVAKSSRDWKRVDVVEAELDDVVRMRSAPPHLSSK